MSSEKQLDIWPEPIGDDKDKRPGADSLPKDVSRDGVEDKKPTSFVPDMLQRMREAPEPSPEEIQRKRADYFQRVLNDQPSKAQNREAEQKDIAEIRARIRTEALKEKETASQKKA